MSDQEGITWLASFPKSGNTWLRTFITAYQTDQPPDINNLFGTVSDKSLRWYQACSAEPVADMEPGTRVLLHNAAMMQLAGSLPFTPKLIKTHNANICVSDTRLIHPLLTKRVVYLVRDPRDVAVSFAKHFGVSLDTAVERMTDSRVTLNNPEATQDTAHWVCSWARHVVSYAEADDLDVTVVRYEDILSDPINSFTWILKWIGVEPDHDRVCRAVERCRIERLRAQEERKGFVETSHHAAHFFGAGGAGGWRDLLSREQVNTLTQHAGEVMKAFRYEVPKRAAA